MRLPAPAYRQAGVGREFGMRIPEFKIIKTGYSKAHRVNQKENFTSI